MARPRLNYQIGLDLGNGNIKVVADDFERRIPSYIDMCKGSDAIGSVTLLADKPTTFCVGYGASKSKTGIPITTDKTMKTEGIDKLYLGALAHLPKLPRVMKSQVVVSSHAWESHKGFIKDKLNQTLECKLSEFEVTLTTEVLSVVPEGFGAIVSRSETKIATLDFGTGTTLLTPYNNHRPQETMTSIEGVQKLFAMIAERMKPINNGYVGDTNDIRRCIEQGTFKTVDGCDFRNIYKDCLLQWWSKYLKDLVGEAQKLFTDGYTILCIGGGVALPSFAQVLKKKGFETVDEKPEMVSARGLYNLAVKKAGAVNA